MSSSMRNAVQRRNHKERAQPLERKHLGLLEKRKDYTLRAKDYAKKKDYLRTLRRKAADRNDDEFYFGMLSRPGPGSALTKGKRSFDGKVAGEREGSKVLSMDVARLLKTQDIGYVRTVRNALQKDVERLRREVVLARGEGAVRKDVEQGLVADVKIVFAESVEERDRHAGVDDGASGEEEDGEGDLGGFDDDEEDDGADVDKDSRPDRKERRMKGKHRRRLERELEAKEKQLKALDQTEHELNVEKAKMAKTATSGGVTKGGERIKVKKRKR